MAAERRGEQAEQAGDTQERPGIRPVAVRLQHGEPGDVLRRHRHDEQRQGDAEERARRRLGEHGQWRRPGERWCCALGQAGHDQRGGDQDGGRYRIEAGPPRDHPPGEGPGQSHVRPLRHPPGRRADMLIEALSGRELEVLRLIAQGFSNQQIAERLSLALSSVKGHNLRIFAKLQVQRRTEAIARARELGLL